MSNKVQCNILYVFSQYQLYITIHTFFVSAGLFTVLYIASCQTFDEPEELELGLLEDEPEELVLLDEELDDLLEVELLFDELLLVLLDELLLLELEPVAELLLEVELLWV